MQNTQNFFEVLSKKDVSKYIQKRAGLDYLPWAVSWQILKNEYPESFYRVYEDAQGRIYHTDGSTAWVKVGLTLSYRDWNGQQKELENVELLAIMDYRHQAIPLERIRSTDAINTIQRCLCKCAARFGVGISLYGADMEDLPAGSVEPEKEAQNVIDMPEVKTVEQLHSEIDAVLKEIGKDMSREEKLEFCRNVVAPVLGGVRNYKLCKDTTKLSRLLSTLKEEVAA